MADTQVQNREGQEVNKTQTAGTDAIYLPNVDIVETGDHIRLLANMPGVDQHAVDVTVENNVLTIEGQAYREEPEGYQMVGCEYGMGKYRRDFTLSTDVDTEKIKARMKHGVLELTIPKREEVKAKKIQIEA